MADTTVRSPDGGWGWVIVASVCMSNFLIVGHAKSFGLYVDPLMHVMQASPSRVAWVASIQLATSNCFAIVASCLCQMLWPRTVAIIGSCIVCVGFAVSSVVRSLALFYFTFGMAGGLGMCFTFNPSLQILGQYFNKRRGIANGICMGGNALGGMVLPLIVAILLEDYGLRGTVLIMGGLVFNSALCAMLWHPVEWHQRHTDDSADANNNPSTDDQDNKVTDVVDLDVVLMGYRSESWSSSNEDAVGATCEPEHKKYPGPQSFIDVAPNREKVPDPREMEFNHSKALQLKCCDNLAFIADGVTEGASEKTTHPEKIKMANGTKFAEAPNRLNKIIDFSLACKPLFWIVFSNQMCILVSYPTTQLFLPLRVLELGFTQTEAALALSSLALADLAGRLVISWLSDFNLCPRSYLFAIGLFMSGIMAFVLPACKSLPSITFVVAAFGFCSGAHVGIFPSRIADLFGRQKVSMVVGMINLLCCPFSLTGSPFMGFIMEQTQSYSVCQGCAGLLLCIGGLLGFTEAFFRTRSRRNVYSMTQEA